MTPLIVGGLIVLAFAVMFWRRRRVPHTFGGYVRGGDMEAAMARAISHARATADDFIIALEQGMGDGFAVKKKFVGDGNSEHAWLVDLAYRDGVFSGTLDNDLVDISGVKLGSHHQVAKDEISDWMYQRDELIHGNFTMRVMFNNMSAKEVAVWRSMLADPSLDFAKSEGDAAP